MGFWRSLRRKVRQFTALSSTERRVLLQAAIMLPAVAIMRRMMSFKRLQAMLARWAGDADGASLTEIGHARQIARIVKAASAHVWPRPNCLDRSLVLRTMLARRNIHSELRFGVSRNGEQFDAHAWIECGGIVLNDADDVAETYAVLDLPTHLLARVRE